ncbi:alpha/beta hydrolase [Flavobacterium crassostreae]|uniref:Alpha/beta hydrolase n=1 Tax=Flavobacterium crassostreae TaxID=1763534 RepID=A0A1B9DYP3_9FLAO|nr:alpha/beta hydrolase [Flavobacterium crassostreae]OCB74812.1 alpha/beta hydrolase [Flavobacterium crassostreae]
MPKKHSKPAQSIKIPTLILKSIKIISYLSPKLTTRLAFKLFTSPIKYPMPKRELEMNTNSTQEKRNIPAINKQVVVYHYGKSSRKVLLVHGWSGRGTQLVKIADSLIQAGYATISFDAPGHGKSPKSSSNMVDFIATIQEINKHYGPFEAAIGHSLGGMSVLNAIKEGLPLKSATIIGSGDIVQDILQDFITKLELPPKYALLLKIHFEKKYAGSMADYSAYKAAQKTTIPLLILHDQQDLEVPVKAAQHIYQNAPDASLILTENLGHRKILGDNKVVQKVCNFTQKHS